MAIQIAEAVRTRNSQSLELGEEMKEHYNYSVTGPGLNITDLEESGEATIWDNHIPGAAT